MAKINVSYSPYRSEFKAERALAEKAKTALNVSDEVIKIDISPTFLIAFLFIVSVLLGCLYLWNFNKISTRGYQLKRLQISQQELKSESDLQTLYVAKAKSMNGLLTDGRLEGMRKPGHVEYVIAENVLAKAN